LQTDIPACALARTACYVEVWCEKDTIASILSQVTAQFDVPLMVARGFSSITFIYGAAEIIKNQVKSLHFQCRDLTWTESP
jgi:hypothetical protein